MLESLIVRFGAEEAHEAPSGIAALGFDPKQFIIQLITFLFVFYILKRFVFGRIIDLLEKRRQVIEEGVRLTTEMVSERDKLEEEVQKKLKQARTEANEVLSKTQEQAAAIIKEAEEAAKIKVEKMMAEARQKIEDETVKARRDLEKEMLNLVVEATEIVTNEKIDAKKDASLLQRALRARA